MLLCCSETLSAYPPNAAGLSDVGSGSTEEADFPVVRHCRQCQHEIHDLYYRLNLVLYFSHGFCHMDFCSALVVFYGAKVALPYLGCSNSCTEDMVSLFLCVDSSSHGSSL